MLEILVDKCQKYKHNSKNISITCVDNDKIQLLEYVLRNMSQLFISNDNTNIQLYKMNTYDMHLSHDTTGIHNEHIQQS